MNIFAVDEHPTLAARALPDKLVVKMPTESLQLLTPWAYNTHGVYTKKPDGSFYSVKGYAHHPCMKWQYESPANVAWLLRHSVEMCKEYSCRYGKRHGALSGLRQVLDLFLKEHGTYFWTNHTPFVLAMPDRYKDPSNPVQSYRSYLLHEKGYAVWKDNNEPEWWDHSLHSTARKRYLAEREAKRLEKANAKHPRVSRSLQDIVRV